MRLGNRGHQHLATVPAAASWSGSRRRSSTSPEAPWGEPVAATSAETITATPAMIWHTKVWWLPRRSPDRRTRSRVRPARQSGVRVVGQRQEGRPRASSEYDRMQDIGGLAGLADRQAQRRVPRFPRRFRLRRVTLAGRPPRRRTKHDCESRGPRSGKCRNRGPGHGRTAPIQDRP